MSVNTAGLLCYVLGWITGIVFVVREKKSTFVKFHAWQSIMTFGVLTVAPIILLGLAYLIGYSRGDLLGTILAIIIIAAIGVLIGILNPILWIILMIQARRGKMWKVPWAGNWAEKQATK